MKDEVELNLSFVPDLADGWEWQYQCRRPME